ncbi:MAG: hypothetical protein GEV11_12965 [Streptosporangiales bacterium]|nr:hypothetical protein [Streptosporangiales bacterium]
MRYRQVQRLFREMSDGEEVRLSARRIGRIAPLVYLAERYGYAYDDARETGGRSRSVRVTLVRDTGPAGRAREAEARERFPYGGIPGEALPGLRAAAFGRLRPLPRIRGELALIEARIGYDVTGRLGVLGPVVAAVLTTAGAVAGVEFARQRPPGETAPVWLIVAMWATIVLLLAAMVALNRWRHARYERRLRHAGYVPVSGEDGRIRYRRPEDTTTDSAVRPIGPRSEIPCSEGLRLSAEGTELTGSHRHRGDHAQ